MYSTYCYKYPGIVKSDISSLVTDNISNDDDDDDDDQSFELDSTYRDIILLVTKGYTSSYAIWSAMNEEAKRKLKLKKSIAYKNVHQRALNLLKHGFLEEIKVDLINMHGRRDYKLTLKGLKQLVPYIKAHPDHVKDLMEYMDKIKFREELFVNVLEDELSHLSLEQKSIASALDLCRKYIPTKDIGIEKDIVVALDKLYEQLRHILESNNIMHTLEPDGKIIRFSSADHPHTRKALAKLASENIEKMKKVLSSNT